MALHSIYQNLYPMYVLYSDMSYEPISKAVKHGFKAIPIFSGYKHIVERIVQENIKIVTENK